MEYDTGIKKVHGGGGDDYLFGAAGSDFLYGDEDNDFIRFNSQNWTYNIRVTDTKITAKVNGGLVAEAVNVENFRL